MATNLSVADALTALRRGDASLLNQIMTQREIQRRKRTGGGKDRRTKKTKSTTNAEEKEDENDAKTIELEEQVRALPRKALDAFYPAANKLVVRGPDDLENDEDADGDVDPMTAHFKSLESLAQFLKILVETKDAAIDPAKVFPIIEELHNQLLRLKGGAKEQVMATQEAISFLCESCWQSNFYDMSHALVTQLLPYLIVRSYEASNTGHFNSKKHPIRRLFAIKDALSLLDFDDDSSQLLRDILLRCYMQPSFFRSPDATSFLSYLFELHLPFVSGINETIRNQIPNQRPSILKKYGSIYFKAWVNSKGVFREKIEEECIQRYINDAVHANSISVFSSVRTVLQIFFENKRHTGVDEMLYRICSPILWRGVKAANDSVRRQAAVLLFDNFPLREPSFNNVTMDLILQKQFDAFEELLRDSHPAVRIAAIQGVSKVLSIYWELLPAETIRCFISKLVVDLVNDVSSSGVRAAVFEGIQFIMDNHNSHSILKPLLPMLAPLINDRNERVRAEFAALLVRIKSVRNMHFYDVVPVNDLLCRLVVDRDCPIVRKQFISLFLNSYFPQSVGGSSQVARCLALVKKNPEAAMVFYGNVVEHTSVGSVCKLSALLVRCSLNFVSRRLKQLQGDDDDDDEDDEEEGFSVVGQIVVLEVIGNLLKSVNKKVMTDPRYAECKSFLAEQLNVQSIEALLLAYSEGRPFDQEALSSIWKIVGYLGELSQGTLLEHLIENFMNMNESSSKKLLESMVDCLDKWNQLPFLVSKLVSILLQWKRNKFINVVISTEAQSKSKKNKNASVFRMNPVVVLGTAEYIAQSPNVQCPKALLDKLFDALHQCISPVLEFDLEDVEGIYKANSFGFIRLLDVYAKFAMMTASAHVSQATTLLMAKNIKNITSKDDLQSLQPSAFFTPPKALVSISGWILRILIELHVNTEAEDIQGKKRRSGKALISEDGLSPRQALLCRWRNLFSLVSLLSAECVAFTLERTLLKDDDPATEFIDILISDLCTALKKMHVFERTVFYQSCQLLYLLHGIKTKKAKKARGVDSNFGDFIALLTRWIGDLQQALECVHAKNDDKCEELWMSLSSSLHLNANPEATAA